MKVAAQITPLTISTRAEAEAAQDRRRGGLHDQRADRGDEGHQAGGEGASCRSPPAAAWPAGRASRPAPGGRRRRPARRPGRSGSGRSTGRGWRAGCCAHGPSRGQGTRGRRRTGRRPRAAAGRCGPGSRSPKIRPARPKPVRKMPGQSIGETACSFTLGTKARTSRHAGDGDRQVEEEDPAPADEGDDGAAQHRADHRPQQGRHGHHRHGADQLVLGRRAQQHQAADRPHHRAGAALGQAEGDELRAGCWRSRRRPTRWRRAPSRSSGCAWPRSGRPSSRRSAGTPPRPAGTW